ncbi:MAG TPA: DUF47 family protein [Acidimicrobiales bacterium]|nr:DUF47 family protein [Acidimicrobiales bacterium]
MARRLPWFLSGEPDLLALLDAQVEATVQGMRAFASWAQNGSEEDAIAVREAEHHADDARRRLSEALREALVTPLEPEDLYTMSERLDTVINGAKNAVRDAEALGWRPDPATADMAALLLQGTEELASAVQCIRRDPAEASRRADEATHCARQVEKIYRASIAALRNRSAADTLEIVTTFEAYRTLLAISDALVHVSHRIWYSVLKAT